MNSARVEGTEMACAVFPIHAAEVAEKEDKYIRIILFLLRRKIRPEMKQKSFNDRGGNNQSLKKKKVFRKKYLAEQKDLCNEL